MEKIVDHPGFSMHGELYIMRAELAGVECLPDDAREERPDAQNRHLVAHSESGHHHYVDAAEARFYTTSNAQVCYLQVDTGTHAYLRHAKSGPDSHGTQRLGPGLYKIHKQREMTPEGWRQVQD